MRKGREALWWLLRLDHLVHGAPQSWRSGGAGYPDPVCLWLVLPAPYSVLQLLSHVQLFVTPWTATHQTSLSFVLYHLLEFAETHVHWVSEPSNHLILCCPLLLLPSVFPRIRVFSNESALLIRWSKYWHFSFSISPSNEYSGLISFRIDWFDLLAVQGTLKSLLQHHNSKASVLPRSAFFIVQLSLAYVTADKAIALIIRAFVVKVMSLTF